MSVSTLVALAARVAERPWGRATLDPSRSHATALADLVEFAAPPLQESLAEAVLAIASAVLEHFPDNIFWDLDALVWTLAQMDPSERDAATELVVELNRRFGRDSVIAFRYAHDFLYGYDWSRWVAKEPESRQGIGPFDLSFLQRMASRGGELEELIARDDAKYPRLPSGEARNPFDFSREPKDEYRLLRELARRDLIPVKAWLRSPPLDASCDYTARRSEVAQQLSAGEV
ncbi:MAG: ferrochelatase [Polyangiaceae bacterium]